MNDLAAPLIVGIAVAPIQSARPEAIEDRNAPTA